MGDRGFSAQARKTSLGAQWSELPWDVRPPTRATVHAEAVQVQVSFRKALI